MHIELELLHDITDLLLQTLCLLVLDVLHEVETDLAQYGHPFLGNTNLGPFSHGALRHLLLGLHLREEQNFLDEGLTCHEHHQSVDTDTNTTGRWHTVLKGAEEVLIDDHGLVVTLVSQLHLLYETLFLIDGVVKLRVGIGQLLTIHHQLKTLSKTRL